MTKSERAKAVEKRIRFEWRQARDIPGLYARLINQRHVPKNRENRGLQSALHGAFVLHVRNLIEFLCCKESRKYLRAANHCKAWRPNGPTGFFKTCFEQADKFVRHCTPKGLEGRPAPWDSERILTALEKELQRFSDATEWEFTFPND